jgi:hypothetical protein
MMFIWALCGVPFGIYAIVQKFNVPIQVQPQCFMSLCLVSWCQILVYHNKWKVWKAALTGVVTACIFAGVEAALILTITPIYNRGNNVPILVIGIVASVLLAVGLLPPYAELWKRHGRVVGINWIFLSMDSCGAFFSLMALVAQSTFDVLGGVLYIICCFLELGIFTSHIIWMVRTRKIRKAAAAEGKSFDVLMAEHEARGEAFHWADRRPIFGGGKKVKVVDEEVGERDEVGDEDDRTESDERRERGGRTESVAGRDEEKQGVGSGTDEPDTPVAPGFPPVTREFPLATEDQEKVGGKEI